MRAHFPGARCAPGSAREDAPGGGGRYLSAPSAGGPPLPIRAVKQVLFGDQKAALEKALGAEVEHQMKCFASEDCLEGVHAFFEKRAPQFHGR